MDILFTNNAKTLLSGALAIGDLTATVDDASNFPSPTGGQFFYATIQDPSDDTIFEIVKVTAVSLNTLTITRAQEGTSAASWAIGSLFELRLTAGGIAAINAHAADHISGGAAEVDGDQLDIDFNPSYYTPAITPAEAGNIDHLAAHLYGIDQIVKPAAQTTRGTIELATLTEAKDGTETGMAITPSSLTGVLKQQSWIQEDGYYIGTDKVRARDGDGLDLEDDGGNGMHVADGGGVTVDVLTVSKLVASNASKNLVSIEATVFETGGAQEIDGDKLDIDWNPTYSTPATTPTEASSVDNLTAHLYGIDQALSNKGTMSNLVEDVTPQLGGQLDVNGNALGDGTLELLKFVETASAVNEITVKNAATGNPPEFQATGDDANINLKLLPKGTGTLTVTGTTNYENNVTDDDDVPNKKYVDDNAGGGMSESSVADDAEITLDTGKTGWGFAQAGDNEEWIQFTFTAAGVVTVIANSANAVNADTDGNLCVYDAGTGIAIKNRLGATKTIRYVVHYSA